MKKITLGMCVYDDFNGGYFSCQANRLLHPVIDADGEILVIDNNPASVDGKATQHFCKKSGFIKYIPFTLYNGTSVRREVFNYANGEIVICIDSHVLLAPGAVNAIIECLSRTDLKAPVLLQGPLLYDSLSDCSLSWLNVWGPGMLGKWTEALPSKNVKGEAFPIVNQGLAAFACKKRDWLDFCPLFRGCGGEEGYLHRKYELAGGSVLCLPDFKWIHRFGRPMGCPTKWRHTDILFNYLVGAFELGEPTDGIIEHFRIFLSDFHVRMVFNEALNAFRQSDLVREAAKEQI